VEWLERQDLGAAEQYWRQHLRGFSGAAALSLSASGAATGSYAERELKLSEAATARLKAVARGRHLTLNTLVQGAWALLLSRYGGEEDVVFGITVSGRPPELAGAEQMVGLFINTLPLRVAVTAEQPVWPWLAELQQQQAEMQSYEYSPLVQVQGWSEVERGAPLFETIFVFENYPIDPLRQRPGGDGALKLLGIQSKEQTNYPLTFRARPEQQLVLNIIFDQQLFEAQTIDRMLGHLQLTLEALATDEEQHLSALPLMNPAEREEVLHGWNQTQQDYPRNLTLQLLFEQQVERTPNQIAVVFDEQQLSYAELNIRANQLAHYLRSAGVGPDVAVGICMERSVEMVVALFGTLKAGGAYLPLDPSYPQERLLFMIDDAQVQVVLTQQRFAGTLAANAVEVVCLDSDATFISQQSSENPCVSMMEENLAYVIYTSGSTGKPKGSMISHRGICNRLLWMQQAYRLDESDRVLQKTPFSFDVSVWEFFWPLMIGAQLVVARPGGHQDSSYLLKLIKTRQITVLHFVPSMLQVFLNEPDLETARCVKKVMCSGEALSFDLQERFFTRLDAELHNLYGPTEASVDVTHWACEREVGQRIVPIGRPIANTEIYILDKTGQPVPAGVRGELHIAGVGLARGYLQRADLTAEKFIPNQFSRQPGERLYRTGDLARYREDGSIEFLGRLDYQLKVRGFRIELGEIESVLTRHPAVRESVVTALESGTGDKQLVAYVVSEAEVSLSVADLRLHLKNNVPEYMVPASFVFLDQLPLTANGKLDRKALPLPEHTRITQPDYVAPRNVVEEILADIWGEVLKMDQVGVADDFFELGGHSLLATQVISRAREALGVNVELRQLFESPTIAELAADIESNIKGEQARMPQFERVSREQALPLSFGQRRLWFLNKLEPESPFYNMSYGVRLTGELDLPALELTVSEIIRRHETLRTCFIELDGEPQQFILPATHVRLEVQDLTALSEAEWQAEVQRIAGQTARQPFDLTAGPLRINLLRGGDNQHVLLVTIHHIASDGWSLDILTREVASLYDAYSQGQQSPLPELAIQYADFAVWQQKWLQGEALDNQLAYWKRQLADVPAVLDLPTDRLRPAVQSSHGAYEGFDLPSKLSEDLRRLSRREGVTLFMSLLAAWQILLSRHAGQEDVVVGSPIANRDHKETEGLIGFFVNTLVLRTDLAGDPTFGEVLKRVRQTTLGAYAHQDLPFEKLVEELHPERTLSHSPLFQVMFTLQNAPPEVLQLSGLTLSGVTGATAPVRFDLMLTMQERRDAIIGGLGYNLDLFDKSTIRRMISHFRQLLEVVVANSDQQLSTLSFVPEPEQRLIDEWNTTDATFPQAARLSELFEWQVAKTPEALAMIFQDVQLTYAELNQRANRLAHHLQRLGVGPQILVGLYLQSPLEMVVAILAVLKAGGAYVPLDSQAPSDRLSFMIADARLPFVLTEQTIQGSLPESQAQIICVDSSDEQLAACSVENPTCPATALSVAYLIYTSGSTGDPKAVLVEHHNIVNLIHASAKKFDFTTTDVMPVLASFAFDISLFELMAPLTTGGTVVLCSRAEVMDLPRLAQIVEQCTMLHMVPSLMRQFLNLLEIRDIGRRYERLRQIFIGGDAVPPDVLAKMAHTFPQARIEVLYGPTEATLFCTSFAVTPAETDSRFVIGRPLPNIKIRICDRHQAPLPIGMAGEICIGGAGVTRGYLSQDRLTKEKFPIIEGRRYYRSGDRGRYLPDGHIEFLGRVDDQVKIRGYRVEPGEVAVALKSHPAVHDAVVIAHSDRRAEKRLVAYVVPKVRVNGTVHHEVEVAQLREYLQQRLPAYMVPAAFVMLDEIPLTLNGKLDKRRLPLPEQVGAAGERECLEPKTETEKDVAKIFAQVLDLERVDCAESFFNMGGHSLLATQVMSRISEMFDVDLPLRRIFESPTVVELSIAIETAVQANDLQVPSRAPEIIRLNRDAYRID
jgi:amino acid adenylation domain-containing protein